MKSVIFDGYSFQVPTKARVALSGQLGARELLHISGPSGIGKSTLLLSMAGFTCDDEQGSLKVDGAEMVGAATSARPLAMVFQGYQLFAHLSVLENLLIAFERRLSLRSLSPELKKGRAAAVLEKLGLVDKLNASAMDLSGGEHQRVALGRALLSEAPWLLLDEPYSALDVTTISKVNDLLREYVAKHEAVVIVTSHRRADFWTDGVRDLEWKAGETCLKF